MEPLRGSIIFCDIGLIQHPRTRFIIVADAHTDINILVEDALIQNYMPLKNDLIFFIKRFELTVAVFDVISFNSLNRSAF